MEAEKLKKKKNTINKGKVKKSIKNVICRPDPVFWPVVTDAEGNFLENALKEHRVAIPGFKKLHWKELKNIPKNKRPKPTSITKVDGLLIGISVCHDAIQNGNCSSVLIEANIDSQILVQRIIEGCTTAGIPVICVKNLRLMSKNYFGIQTSCLGIEKGKLMELRNAIKKIYHNYKLNHVSHKSQIVAESNEVKENNVVAVGEIVPQNNDIYQSKDPEITTKFNSTIEMDTLESSNPYLFRTNKKTRAFVPDNEKQKERKQFSGQQFIKITDNAEKTDNKSYMNMILKKMSNNANRVKLKPNKK